MSTDLTTPKTDQELNGERILQAMQAQNGGELVQNPATGRLVLLRPPVPPQ